MTRRALPAGEKRAAMVALRCTEADKARIDAAAAADGRTTSDWLLRLARQAVDGPAGTGVPDAVPRAG